VKLDIEGWEGMAPRSETAAMLAARGYLPFAVKDDGSLRATCREAAVAMRALTNLVLLKAEDTKAI
jgi:hypothetical protein